MKTLVLTLSMLLLFAGGVLADDEENGSDAREGHEILGVTAHPYIMPVVVRPFDYEGFSFGLVLGAEFDAGDHLAISGRVRLNDIGTDDLNEVFTNDGETELGICIYW